MSQFQPTASDQGTPVNTAPRFNVPSALALLYGVVNPVSYPGVVAEAQARNPEVSYMGITLVEDDEQRPLSPIGTPVFYPVTLKGGEYKRHDRQGKVETVRMPELRLPITTVVEMSCSKTITKTPVVAAAASVKEVYAIDDWSITISGILWDEANQPQGATTLEAMQERIMDWFRLADSIEVDGELFHQRGIFRIVLKDISFNQMPGKRRLHGFQMSAESDDPLELILQ
ncbi:MAG: hypothetical protein JNL05_10575 [Flavobacteriales bacterium]|nr:hypothetical protein [Flavobacteriales bacterium]